MADYIGVATLFVGNPSSACTLPVQGRCTVSGTQVTVKFPATGAQFDLPHVPDPEQKDYQFSIHHAKGNMLITIEYDKKLNAYSGTAKREGQNKTAWTFIFYEPQSPLAKLPM